MKAFKAFYRHGKLYDVESKKRIHVKENAMINFMIDDNQLMDEDPYNKKLDIVDSKELLKEIISKEFFSYKKFALIGDSLKFMIKAGKNTTTKNYSIECTFTVKLLSDLYMTQKYPETIYGVVYPCACIVNSVKGPLDNFEPIYAYSLNDAYMKTYDWYFALYGKPTANVYNTFSLIRGEKERSLAHLRMFGTDPSLFPDTDWSI